MRIFPKPDLRKKTMEVSESIFRDPKELEALKAKVSPEVYLSTLYQQISQKERELEVVKVSAEETKKKMDEALSLSSAEIHRQIEQVESVLKIKRQERIELEKPIEDRNKSLDERANSLDIRAKGIDEREQQVFEKERETEAKLDALKDLSDDLGETRTRLQIKEKLILGKEGSLKNREFQYLLAVEDLNARRKQLEDQTQEREYAIQLKELGVQSKEENLVRREKELLNGHILLNDQRGTLERAWKELEKKQHGRRT